MAENASVVPYLSEVTIGAIKQAGSTIKVVVYNSCHILATGAVSGVESTSSTGFMAGHAKVSYVLTEPASRAGLSTLGVNRMLIVLFAGVVGRRSTLSTLL